MNEPGKSDNRVVPEKVSNKARRRREAERLEERRLGERNRPQARALRTQGRTSVHAALGRVRRAAEQKKGVRFTALLHHIYAIDTLRAAFYDWNVMRHQAWTARRGSTMARRWRRTSPSCRIGCDAGPTARSRCVGCTSPNGGMPSSSD